MKYRLLTREQFEALHEDFSRFLATQQIDAGEWEEMKSAKPDLAEEEMKVFSDIVWEDVLSKVKFIEHISEQHMNLFQCNSKEIIRVYVHWKEPGRSFLDADDFKQFKAHPLDDTIEYYKAVKPYETERNKALFELIEMGGQITDGSLYKSLIQLVL
jgi:hypothetical protein